MEGFPLVAWLRAALDEDERLARGALPAPWQSGDDDDPGGVHYGEFGWSVYGAGVEAEDSEAGKATAQHIARWDPARVLAEVEAKRARIDELADALATDGYGSPGYAALNDTAERLLKLEAQPLADRPGFKAEWRMT